MNQETYSELRGRGYPDGVAASWAKTSIEDLHIVIHLHASGVKPRWVRAFGFADAINQQAPNDITYGFKLKCLCELWLASRRVRHELSVIGCGTDDAGLGRVLYDMGVTDALKLALDMSGAGGGV